MALSTAFVCSRRVRAAIVAALAATIVRCGGTSISSVAPSFTPPGEVGGTAVLVGAGDIATCGPGATATALLLDQIEGVVFTAGDNAYPDGSADDYRRCYEPTWGRHKSRTR